MKPHPRIRKTVKWGGAICAALFAVLFLAAPAEESGWRDGTGMFFGLVGKQVAVYRLDSADDIFPAPDSGAAIFFVNHDRAPELIGYLFFGSYIRWRGSWYFGASLLFPVILGALCSIGAWSWQRTWLRRYPHLCAKCGYSRRGLPSADAVCPECGAAFTPPVA